MGYMFGRHLLHRILFCCCCCFWFSPKMRRRRKREINERERDSKWASGVYVPYFLQHKIFHVCALIRVHRVDAEHFVYMFHVKYAMRIIALLCADVCVCVCVVYIKNSSRFILCAYFFWCWLIWLNEMMPMSLVVAVYLFLSILLSRPLFHFTVAYYTADSCICVCVYFRHLVSHEMYEFKSFMEQEARRAR